ncbi:MAG TPA: alpha/beta hydrolase [Sphaerochaeta sp.]|nr:alpha/beta hydrolase [Sphaerochaeta sp.]HQB05976.1 alpha/beta hydrolase [Sphaerochaeta sp.]
MKTISRGIRILLIVFLLALFIYNRLMYIKEEPLRRPLGQLVEVDGRNMSVYTEGKGERTLVFMAASAVAAPILEYKPLYTLLGDDYRIVVIEKFGYGFSDVVDGERSFETMLRQDREVLSKAGIEGPFILCPHSMSGIEAILWAQRYPDEVEAIIGLDMSVPGAYGKEDFSWKRHLLAYLLATGREIGIVRLFFTDSTFSDALTHHEKDIYRAVASSNYCNKNVRSEGKHIPKAIDLINSEPKPDLPMLMFISDGSETGGASWIEAQKEYASNLTDAQTVDLDCGHMIHKYEQERINKNMREFIESLNGLER